MRAKSDGVAEFVADADSNYDLPFLRDDNNDGVLDEMDEAIAPGVWYYSLEPDLLKLAFLSPKAHPKFITDQWGTFISGYSPIQIIDSPDRYLIQVDMNVEDIFTSIKQRYSTWPYAISSLSVLVLSLLLLFGKRFKKFN